MSDIEWTHFSDGAHMMSRYAYTVECRYNAVQIYHDITYGVAKTATERKPLSHRYIPQATLCSHSQVTLPWRHNERDGVSNQQLLDALLNRLFRLRSKKTSKLIVTGLCEGNSTVTSELSQRNAENVSIWWCHHESDLPSVCLWFILFINGKYDTGYWNPLHQWKILLIV